MTAELPARSSIAPRAPLAPPPPNQHSDPGRGCGLDGRAARLPLQRHPVASHREVRAEDELALETARLETAVCLGDLIEGDPLGDARRDGASCQQPEEPL